MKIKDSILQALSVKSLVMSLSGVYVAVKLSLFFPLLSYWGLVGIFLLLSLSFPLLTYLERTTEDVKVRKLYYVSSLFAGLLFILLTVFLVHETLNLFTWLLFDVHLYQEFFGYLTLMAVFVLFIHSYWEGQKLYVRNETIYTSKKIKSKKLVHFSDVHIGAINLKKQLEILVQKVNEENPDIICITGDLLDGSGIVNEYILSPLNELKAKTYFATGNHETYFGKEKACTLIAEQGIHVLKNKVIKHEDFEIVGVDYPLNESSQGIVQLKTLQKEVTKSKFSILMYHAPKGLEDFKRSKIDLMLSGHTHKGQLYPFEYVLKFFYKYFYGLYKIGNQYINVTSGAGTWGPPMRLGTRNEIVSIKIQPKKS